MLTDSVSTATAWRIELELHEIWQRAQPQFPELTDRGWVFCENQEQKDILITGINPSYRQGAVPECASYSLDACFAATTYDSYWSSLKKMVCEGPVNLCASTAFLDLFFFRETDQSYLRKNILPKPEGLRFIADQLALTQRIIEEVIKPRLIIVKNKESAAYWGHYEWVWMGYDLEPVDLNLPCGALYKVKGLRDVEGRVNPQLIDTNLEGALVLFTSHFQYAAKEKRPNAALVQELYWQARQL